MFVVPSNSASFQFPPISVHTDVESLLSFFIFYLQLSARKGEVQTLRCAISSRTRAVDGISPMESRHIHHHFPLHFLF